MNDRNLTKAELRLAHRTPIVNSFSRNVVFLTCALISVDSAIAADIVTKKSDGKKISGTITGMTREDVTVKRTQGEETVRVGDIASVEWDGGGVELKLGYTDEENGRLDKAIQRFLKAKSDAKSPSPYLQGEFDYIIARVTAKQAGGNGEKRANAIQKLLAAQKSYPDHVRFYDSINQLTSLQLAAADFAGARKALEELKRAASSDLKLAARIAEARVLVGEGKIEESITAFASVAQSEGDSQADLTRKYEAILGQAKGLIALSKFDEALKVLESITEHAGPLNIPVVEAEAFVLQGNALKGSGRIKDAILAFLSVDILFPRETEFHAESLFQLSQLWKLDQHQDRSAEAAGKLAQLYPNSDWRKKLGGSE